MPPAVAALVVAHACSLLKLAAHTLLFEKADQRIFSRSFGAKKNLFSLLPKDLVLALGLGRIPFQAHFH